METRTFETRNLTAPDSESRMVRGTAIVYGQTADLGDFREKIEPGAIKEVLSSRSNIRLLYEHDRRGLLATTRAQSLTIKDTPEGLTFKAEIVQTQTGNDVLALIKAGEIRGMSFAFTVAKNGQTFTRTPAGITRTITKFATVPEITITSAPAYDTTDVAVRSLSSHDLARIKELAAIPPVQELTRRLRTLQAHT